MLKRSLRVVCLLTIGAVVGLSHVTQVQAAQPNVLIIMADDCTYNDLPVYGGQNAHTPHIDQLASEGLTFNRAYLASAMCQPCRAELYTGLYPMGNGCAWNHSASKPDVRSMPHYMGELGYRVGIAGKVHVKPDAAFPFQGVDGFDSNCVRNPTQEMDLTQVKSFISANDQPFCLVIALVEPHLPWVMGDPSRYPPRQIKLPPHVADTPKTRQDFSRYLAEITYMDDQVGQILQALDESGQRDQTLVMFSSEQGAQFPGCKWTNWDTGLHTALIARWPKQISAGRRTDALVQYADVLPTIIDVAKPDTSKGHDFDGSSFLPVLLGHSDTHRKYVYGSHNNIPEGPAYPIRTVSDGQYRYIRNLSPDEIYIEKHVMGSRGNGELNNPYWASWVWHAADDAHTYELVRRYTRRPPEHFYHTAADPYEMNNLATDPQLAQDSALSQRKAELSEELDRWMKQQHDPGADQDTSEAIQAARNGKHLYGNR